MFIVNQFKMDFIFDRFKIDIEETPISKLIIRMNILPPSINQISKKVGLITISIFAGDLKEKKPITFDKKISAPFYLNLGAPDFILEEKDYKLPTGYGDFKCNTLLFAGEFAGPIFPDTLSFSFQPFRIEK